ncbi:MAG: hypothetical protein GY751_07230 [Bacteroidetes bacterium]|nr:hypothetical protein [Bacteroidota bacterium]
MRYFLLLIIMASGISLSAQPDQEAIYSMLDTYDFGQPKDQPAVSTMVDDSKTSMEQGTFLLKGRTEYLIELLLAKGSMQKEFAFIAFVDDSGVWNRSDWFVYGYTRLDRTDIESDGIHELIHQVDVPGVMKTQQRYRLISLLDDVETEIYKVDGFSPNVNYFVRAGAGDHMSSVFDVELIDMDGDGVKEISETITDEYFQFQYDNININQVFDEGHETKGERYQQKTTVYKVKNGNLEVLEIK